MEDKQKCRHATCTCPALPFQDYCCEQCQLAVERDEAGEEPLSDCRCHHADCGGATEVPAETQSLLMASEVLAAT
jgi:hypothetical protein